MLQVFERAKAVHALDGTTTGSEFVFETCSIRNGRYIGYFEIFRGLSQPFRGKKFSRLPRLRHDHFLLNHFMLKLMYIYDDGLCPKHVKGK
jgi:hypothetical protein